MRGKFIYAALAALCLTGLGNRAAAEDMPVYTLDQVVVTANRTEEKQLDANADVTVVTSKEIERHHYQDVSEAVRHVPGVIIGNHSASGQNYNSNTISINGSSNVVVMVDGMRRNTNGIAGSVANLGDFSNMGSIERIEVLKGSSSTLYGSDAQGGVINIITKRPAENGIHTTLSGSFGSYDGEKYNLYNEGKEGKLFWTVEAGKQLQGEYKDGWGRHVINHLNAEHYGVKLGYDMGNDSDVIFRYEKYKSDYARPDQGSNDTYDDKGKKNDDSLSLQYDARINSRLTNKFSLYRNRTTFNDNYNLNGASWPFNWNMGMRTTGISDQLTYTGASQTIIGGVDWYKDKIDKYTGDASEGANASNTAFYIQDKIDLTNRWNVTPGIRYDHHSDFGSHTSPSISIGYKQNDRTNYYFNYKEFFVAPNLYQLNAGFYGNKHLNPEEGYTLEFGINHEFDNTFSGNFNIFRQHAKNRIISDPMTWKYENSGEMDSMGASLSLEKKFTGRWSGGLGYTYLHIRPLNDKQNENLNGRLPQSTVDVHVDYNSSKFDARLTGRGILNRYGNKSAPIMKDYGNFWVWDLAANYKLKDSITLYGRLNNIFNQFYTDIGTSTDPYHSWYSAPGRNFELGVQLTF